MRHALGLGDKQRPNLRPVLPNGRLRFSTDDERTLGYFRLIAPAFEKFAKRDAQTSIFAINVLIVLRGDDLAECLAILVESEAALLSFPEIWRSYLGDEISTRDGFVGRHPFGQASAVTAGFGEPDRIVREIRPLLFRARALRVVVRVRKLIEVAINSGGVVLYGNGVAARAILGTSLPPGVVEYS
jgi:hypothetical protein